MTEKSNPKFDEWCLWAVSSIKLYGQPAPLLTELIYIICNNDEKKFNRATEMLREAFEAGEKAAAK